MKIGLASKVFRSNSHNICREFMCKQHGVSRTWSVEISKNEQFRIFYVQEFFSSFKVCKTLLYLIIVIFTFYMSVFIYIAYTEGK